jgi:hypothetical protein
MITTRTSTIMSACGESKPVSFFKYKDMHAYTSMHIRMRGYARTGRFHLLGAREGGRVHQELDVR